MADRVTRSSGQPQFDETDLDKHIIELRQRRKEQERRRELEKELVLLERRTDLLALSSYSSTDSAGSPPRRATSTPATSSTQARAQATSEDQDTFLTATNLVLSSGGSVDTLRGPSTEDPDDILTQGTQEIDASILIPPALPTSPEANTSAGLLASGTSLLGRLTQPPSRMTPPDGGNPTQATGGANSPPPGGANPPPAGGNPPGGGANPAPGGAAPPPPPPPRTKADIALAYCNARLANTFDLLDDELRVELQRSTTDYDVDIETAEKMVLTLERTTDPIHNKMIRKEPIAPSDVSSLKDDINECDDQLKQAKRAGEKLVSLLNTVKPQLPGSISPITTDIGNRFSGAKLLWKEQSRKFYQIRAAMEEKQQEDKASKDVLPKTELPHFNGSISQYYHWMNQLEDLLLSKKISDIDKVHRTIQTLKGSAKDAVKNFNPEQGLPELLTLIKELYGNPIKLRNYYTEELMKLRGPPLEASVQTCRQFVAKLDDITTCLERSGKKIDDLLISDVIIPRLPKFVQLRLSLADTEIKDYQELRKIMETAIRKLHLQQATEPPPQQQQGLMKPKRVTAAAATAPKKSPQKTGAAPKSGQGAAKGGAKPKASYGANASGNKAAKEGPGGGRPRGQQAQKPQPQNCILCGAKGHVSAEFCSTFTQANTQGRQKFTREHHLCYKCLAPHCGGRASTCKRFDMRCMKKNEAGEDCLGRHNPLIHEIDRSRAKKRT